MRVKRAKSLDTKTIKKVTKLLKQQTLSGFNAGTGPSYFGGPYVQKLENKFESYFKVKHAISVNSWTSGLHIAVNCLDIRPGSEIICSPWSMSATVASIVNNGCVPVFADIDLKTFNIDPNEIIKKITRKTKAILYTDMYGQSADVTNINKIAKKYNLYTISDGAQAIGSTVRNQFTSTFADIGGFSFNWHKHLDCGEGGMVVTNNDDLARKMKMLRNHSETHGYKFGHNYRMTEMCAVIVLDQLPKLKKFIGDRKKIVDLLRRHTNFSVHFPRILETHTHSYCSLPLYIDNYDCRDMIYDKLKDSYPVTNTFSRGPLNKLKLCKPFYKQMPNAEKLDKHLLDIDLGYDYTPNDLVRIATIINTCIEKCISKHDNALRT